jgi:membrane-associated protease RseP (regulator of RpoE activity)
LALINLLPVPVLNCGALLFWLVEWVRGHPASVRLQSFANGAGVVAMTSLFVLSVLHNPAGFGLLHH